MQDVVRLVFPEGIAPESPNELQLEMLRELGAPMIYTYLNSTVTLRKTLTEKDSTEIDERVGAALRKGVLDTEYIFDRREGHAVAEMKKFFETNPGAHAVLVYGAAHDFVRHCGSTFNPHMVRLDLS